MPRTTNWDPLDVIPTSTAVERTLADAELKAKQLRVLLRTARQIERAGLRTSPVAAQGEVREAATQAEGAANE